MIKRVLILMAFLLPLSTAKAADFEVKMLDFGSSGGMVFEPGFLNVQPGDRITFVPTASGHFVRSALLPDGVPDWRSPLDKAYTVTVREEGVYVYYCPPHLTMAMVGVIQVGEAKGRERILAEMTAFNRRQLQHKKRLWSYLDRVQWAD